MIVLAAFAASALSTRQANQESGAAIEDDAVLVDLPPVAASPAPKSDADEGPGQRASEASAAATTPKPMEPTTPAEDVEPSEEPSPPPQTPMAPDAAAVLEHTPSQAPPQQDVAAPATAPQDETAPQGSDTPSKDKPSDGSEGQPHSSRRAMTAWQKAMMSRLEGAKRSLPRHLGHSGTVQVAFGIDTSGRLVAESIRQSSGDDRLDNAALALIKQAAPFPSPPPGAGAAALSFTVPIRFRH